MKKLETSFSPEGLDQLTTNLHLEDASIIYPNPNSTAQLPDLLPNLKQRVKDAFGLNSLPKQRIAILAEPSDQRLVTVFPDSQLRDRSRVTLTRIRRFIEGDAVADKFHKRHDERVQMRQDIARVLGEEYENLQNGDDWASLMRAIFGKDEFDRMMYGSQLKVTVLGLTGSSIGELATLYADSRNYRKAKPTMLRSERLSNIIEGKEPVNYASLPVKYGNIEAISDKLEVVREFVDAAVMSWNQVYDFKGAKRFELQVT